MCHSCHSLDNLKDDFLKFSDMKLPHGLAVVDPENPAQDVGRLPEEVDVLGGEDNLSKTDQLGAPAFPLKSGEKRFIASEI